MTLHSVLLIIDNVYSAGLATGKRGDDLVDDVIESETDI